MSDKQTVSSLKAMKAGGEETAGIVAWDYHMARIADLSGADLL